MRKNAIMNDYIRPEMAKIIYEEVALFCDSLDGENEDYNREDYIW